LLPSLATTALTVIAGTTVLSTVHGRRSKPNEDRCAFPHKAEDERQISETLSGIRGLVRKNAP
jgi:hypothetical protein